MPTTTTISSSTSRHHQHQRKRDVLMFAVGSVCTLAIMGMVQNLSGSARMMMMMTTTTTTPSFNSPLDVTLPATTANQKVQEAQEKLETYRSKAASNGTVVATSDTDKQTKDQDGEWTHYDGVVIATKIHGPDDRGAIRQVVCLLTEGYNKYVKYNIIIFSTLPWEDEHVKYVQEYAGDDVKVTVVADPFTLEERLANMSDTERSMLFKRCNEPENGTLTWDHRCCEEGYPHCTGLGYAWQSEFRSYQVWTRSALDPYKYMFWFDSDAFLTQAWTPKNDPVKVMIENDLLLLFDNFPRGRGRDAALKERIQQAYNTSLCFIGLEENGAFRPRLSPDCNPNFGLVHGFFHITNLDFYRSEQQMKWSKILTAPYHFQRQFDDQIAVTVPPAILAPHRAWDMRRAGLNLSVWHNGEMDGKVKEPIKPRGYKKWFHTVAKDYWPEGYNACKRVTHHAGRR